MATHETLTKNNLIPIWGKKKHCLPKYIWFWVKMWWMKNEFTSYVTYNLFMRCPIEHPCFWIKHWFQQIVVTCLYYFQPWLKNIHTHQAFFLFCFSTSSEVKGFSIGYLLPSSFEALLKSTSNYELPTISSISLVKTFTCFITFPFWCHQLSNAS